MEWISVKDKMPTGFDEYEDGTIEPAEYIVHVKGAQAATTAMFDGTKFVKYLYEDLGNFEDKIDYWMELPKPPKD